MLVHVVNIISQDDSWLISWLMNVDCTSWLKILLVKGCFFPSNAATRSAERIDAPWPSAGTPSVLGVEMFALKVALKLSRSHRIFSPYSGLWIVRLECYPAILDPARCIAESPTLCSRPLHVSAVHCMALRCSSPWMSCFSSTIMTADNGEYLEG